MSQLASQAKAPEPSPPSRAKVVSGGIIGNLFEWYDFTVYGFFAPVIAVEFFGAGNPTTDLLKAFAVFAVGYFARPIGGILFGFIGDRMGRRKALLLSLGLMSLPTLGMVLMPTWTSVGLLSPILLILFRVLQGISIGGEFTGATAYLTEHGKGRRGFTGAMTVSSAMLGILLGSLVFTIMDWQFTQPFIQAWGWRIAFAFGLLILVVAAWLRWKMPVSPHFKKAQESGTLQRHPIRHCLKTQRGQLARALVLISFPALLCYALTVYMAEYLVGQCGLPRSMAGLIVTIAIAVSVVLPLIVGHASDRWGRRPFIRFSFVLATAWSIPLFFLSHTGLPAYAWLAVLLGAVMLGIMQGVYPAALTELFPTSTRYSGTSIAYNISFALFGGTFPFMATWLVHLTDNALAPGWYLGAAGLISTILIWRMPETGLSPLPEG